MKNKNFDDAEPVMMRAFQETQSFKAAEKSAKLTRTLMDLGEIHMAQGKAPVAEFEFRRCTEIFEHVIKNGTSDQRELRLGDAYLQLGLAYAKQNKFDEARAEIAKAFKAYGEDPNAKHLDPVWIKNELDFMDRTENKPEVAAAFYKKVQSSIKGKNWAADLCKERLTAPK